MTTVARTSRRRQNSTAASTATASSAGPKKAFSSVALVARWTAPASPDREVLEYAVNEARSVPNPYAPGPRPA